MCSLDIHTQYLKEKRFPAKEWKASLHLGVSGQEGRIKFLDDLNLNAGVSDLEAAITN